MSINLPIQTTFFDEIQNHGLEEGVAKKGVKPL
jgi:hypothetical protein